jgi:hypothetical protein
MLPRTAWLCQRSQRKNARAVDAVRAVSMRMCIEVGMRGDVRRFFDVRND